MPAGDAVDVRQPRLAWRAACPRDTVPHKRVDQARFADIRPPHQRDGCQPIPRKVAYAGGAAKKAGLDYQGLDGLEGQDGQEGFAIPPFLPIPPFLSSCSVGNRVVDDGAVDRFRLRLGREAASQRFRQRDLQDLVHRLDQIDV
jgi:hypothetical protein